MTGITVQAGICASHLRYIFHQSNESSMLYTTLNDGDHKNYSHTIAKNMLKYIGIYDCTNKLNPIQSTINCCFTSLTFHILFIVEAYTILHQLPWHIQHFSNIF
jgi:hypothetical protein